MDFFLSYSGVDRDWAGWLTYQLEDLGYSVELADRDWPAGSEVVTSMDEAIERGDRIVAVLSHHYFAEGCWAGHELRSALFRSYGHRKDWLLPVRIDDVEPPATVGSFKRVELAGLSEREAREALVQGLAPGQGWKRPAFPGTPASRSRPSVPFPPASEDGRARPTTAADSHEASDPAELPRSNVSRFLDPFVGRDEELVACRTRLLDGSTRLLTILGFGGAGKTRFCQELGVSLLDEFDQHVYFVDLTTVSDPELVIASITRALRIKAGDPVLEALKELFRDRRVLLLLDNFEHVQEGAPAVHELLEATTSLSVVATSRRPLEIDGEYQHDLRPLSRDEAVRLFAVRAERSGAGPDYGGGSESGAVARLCERLDDLPLAIELVAARAAMLAPDELLTMLRGRALDLPATRQNVSERQRSLRATIDWSYNLLEERERQLFRRLAVFQGGWTFTTAARLLGDRDPFAPDLLDSSFVLLRNRLLRRKDDRTRMTMLATLREYALERLEEEPEEAARLRARHARLFLALADEAAPGLAGPGQREVFARLEVEQDNLAAALDHFVGGSEVEQALRLGAVLGRFWWVRDYAEGWERLGRVLALDCPPELDRRGAMVLMSAGGLGIRLGRLDEAAAMFEESLRLARRAGDVPLEALALSRVALVQMEHAEFETALPLLEQALAKQREYDDMAGLADTLDTLGVLATGSGNDRAQEYLEESRSFYQRLGDAQGEAWVCNDLARLALAQDEFSEARRFADEALAVGQQQTDWALIAWAQNYLGLVKSREKDFDDAREDHLASLARVLLLGDKRPCALALEGFSALAAEQGRGELAATLDGAARALRDRSRIPRTRSESRILDRRLDPVRRRMSESAFTAAMQRGQGMSLEEAVSLARGT